MDNRQRILKIIRSKKRAKTSDLVAELGISRQKVAQHLSKLVREGLLYKEGSTRASVYSIAEKKGPSDHGAQAHMVKNLKGLREDIVYNEIELRIGLKALSPNVRNIAFYAFGEMLNNAIDHSRSGKVDIQAELNRDVFSFRIRDFGIGIFANIQKKFHLQNEFVAMEHVLKGKQTTFPEQHSGQGIFFTSKIADLFEIKSHKIEISKDNLQDDWRLKDRRMVRGTEVHFAISRRSRKILRDLFVQYANEEYEFDRTNVKIHLTADRELLARSQAKRILMGLEQYKVITLDFKKVKEVGQAFVDEVFRVFKNRHPDIQILYVNTNPAVEFMIQRGLKL